MKNNVDINFRTLSKHFARLSSLLVLWALLWGVLDFLLNGTIINWIDATLIDHNQSYSVLNIATVKFIIAFFSVMLILLIYGLVEGIAYYRIKKERRKCSAAIEKAIEGFISEKSEEHIRDYPQIRERMLSYRDSMQKKEEIIRFESVKKNELITYLAHDLKTPLTSVIGYLSLLDEAHDMPAEQRRKFVKIALDKSDRLELLLNEFFDITRYNYHAIKLNRMKVNLTFLLIQMADEFYPILSADGKTITLNLDEELMINADPMQLARAFNNILKNAASYSFENTGILVTAKRMENQVVITFQNDGKQIPGEKLNEIFEKFYRLDEARATNNGGAGLGLAITKEIIKLHNGEIYASSEEGKTTFTIILTDEQ